MQNIAVVAGKVLTAAIGMMDEKAVRPISKAQLGGKSTCRVDCRC